MNLKHILFCFVLFLSIKTFSQELNIGGNVGLMTDKVSSLMFKGGSLYSLGVALEHRPSRSIFSINIDPYIFINRQKIILTEPIYFKLIFGNKIRVCPAAGAYVRSNFNYGWFCGAHIDYVFEDKFIVFFNGDFNTEYFKRETTSHSGRIYISQTSEPWFMLSFGIKKNFRFKSHPESKQE